ncbi:MAG: hypothetical protein FJW39_05325 [Acidobacteria bacterium]|nr:hypothetical protein [Acidobacteriota bacterium]
MPVRLAVLVIAAGLCLHAQMKMSVNQLVQFIRSSVQLKHPDKQVAAQVRKLALTDRLEDRIIEDLQGLGAGPRTVEALQGLRDQSKALTPAMIAAPKAPAPPIPPPSADEQNKVLAAARDFALNYSKQLPNFICTQVTTRYVDPSGLEFWQKADVITSKVSFFEQKEDYKVILVNSQPVTQDVHISQVGGFTTAGEFGSMLKEIFEAESEAAFTWTRWTTLRGQRNHVFGFQVRQDKSKRTVSYQKTMVVTPGYRGSIYVDANTNMITRVRLDHDLPPTFPITQAVIDLDYDLVDIGGVGAYMLPLRHVARIREAKLLQKNEAEFRMYRKFGADTSITFETPEPLPEDKFKEEPPLR